MEVYFFHPVHLFNRTDKWPSMLIPTRSAFYSRVFTFIPGTVFKTSKRFLCRKSHGSRGDGRFTPTEASYSAIPLKGFQ